MNLPSFPISENKNIPTPRFTGIFIPVEVLEMEDLTHLDQLLISWIDALYCKDHGGCFAKNEYLAEKLRVKENTIAKAITKLRSIGLIEDVSFDGRNRVIRACIGKYLDKCQSKAGLDLNPRQGWTKIQSRVGFLSNAHIENKEESKEENKNSLKVQPKIPPKSTKNTKTNPTLVVSAKADEERDKKLITEIPKETKELGDAMIAATIEAVKGTTLTYLPPKNRKPLYDSLDAMIRLDGRNPQFILDVLRWALGDSFWLDKMLKPNIAKYLRQDNRIDQLNAKMNQIPAKKERKFAPGSDDKKALASIQGMTKL